MRVRQSITHILVVLLFLSRGAHGESLADLLADPAVKLSRPEDRGRVVARMAAIEHARNQQARDRATALGLPHRTTTPSGLLLEIADIRPNGLPLYRTTHNANAAISTGANLLRVSPYSLNGSGVTIGLWDGGSARSTHQEFGGRVTVKDGSAAGDHATHVGGTMIASGVVSSARGMANAAAAHSYDWNSDASEMTSRGAASAGAADAIYLSNHSYGYLSGWSYVGSAGRLWEWWGDGTTATSSDGDFGRYNTYARDQDALAHAAPYYLIFRSAGNDRSDNPAFGDPVALAPGSSTTVSYDATRHPGGDGVYRGGFDNIGFEALSKNVITVGSVSDAVTSGLRDVAKANISPFSSWGPTDDGRIKPDVVANGETLYSSLAGSNTSYGNSSGTSMSTPNACGSASLLIQQYALLFPGQAMRASTLKGLLIHTADDRGNAGPDYKFGWGLINMKAAADLLIDHQAYPAKQRLTENQISSTVTTRTHSFVWDGVSPIRATLCWTDPAGTATSTSDLRSPRLMNNLNLKLIAPNGTEVSPFVMPFVGTWTQASMDLAATTGINNTDNVEQVLVPAPGQIGTWRAVVSFAGTLANNQQNYSFVLTGSKAEDPPPPPLALASINPAGGLANSIVTVDITGTSLRVDTVVKLTKSGHSDLTASAVQLIGETLRCQLNLSGAASGPWNVVATNPNAQSSTLANAFTVVGAIWSENFDGAVSSWTTASTTGSNSWVVSGAQSHSPSQSYFAPAPAPKTTTYLTSPSISVPAGANNLQFKFWHLYNLESTRDGGRLEFSVNNGAWFLVSSAGSGMSYASNGPNSTLTGGGAKADRNEFAGEAAWTGNSNGFIETIVNLTDTAKFAGKTLRARWCISTNATVSSTGWYVDSVSLIGGGDLTNQPPTIAAAATSSSTETQTDSEGTIYQIIRGTSANLSVGATDDGGEPSLTYTWSASGPAAVFLTPNSANAAKSTVADFEAAGDYQISVTVRDSQGLSVSSSVNLRVVQTASGLAASPPNATIPVGATQAFSAMLNDQFGISMAIQPPSFTWATSGGGSISPAGIFTATTAGGPYAITVSHGSFSNFASITVTPAAATIALGNLVQTYDGNAKPVTVTTSPAGLAYAVTYSGSATPPVNVGSYAIAATITDPNYQGSASGTLTIEPANTFASWKNAHFTAAEQTAGLASQDANPDSDDLNNLAEYALGTDPREFTPPLVPALDAMGLSLTFTRPAGLPDVIYAAESSSGLDDWTAIPLEIINVGDPETVRARDPLTSGDRSKRFLRLRFQSP